MRKVLWLTLLVCLSLFAHAQEAPATPRLIVKELASHPVGAPVDVELTLLGIEDRPLGNNVLEIYLNGEYLRRVRTDEDGTARARVSRELPVGEYQVSVVFIGTQAYLPAEATLPLVIRPAVLTVQTVPPLANIPFALDDQTFHSDQYGIAMVVLREPGTYTLKLLLEDDTLHTPDTRISFARWNDAVFTRERTVEVRNNDPTYQVGFELSHPVTTAFIDLDDEPVDWSRVTALTLKSSAAAYRTLTEEKQPYWLQANRIMRQRSGIFPTEVQWSVESVMLNGSNVVNRYQQRYYAQPDATWEVRLLLYQARIRSTDAFFGYSVGDGVAVTYPDGYYEELYFNEENELRLPNMARGLYKLQVIGGSGVAPVTPVAMTRDQDVVLKVLSGVDIGALIFAGISLAFGLLFVGRPHLIGLKRYPALEPAPKSTYTYRALPATGVEVPGLPQGSGLLQVVSREGETALEPFVPDTPLPPTGALDKINAAASTPEGRALIESLRQSAQGTDWQPRLRTLADPGLYSPPTTRAAQPHLVRWVTSGRVARAAPDKFHPSKPKVWRERGAVPGRRFTAKRGR